MKRSTAYFGVFVLSQFAVAGTIPIELSAFGSNAIVLTFDELAADFVIGSYYQSKGIVFDNAKVDGRGQYYISPPNLLYSNLTNTAGEVPLTAHFANGATRVGVNCDSDGFVGGRQPQMRAFDASNALIGVRDCLGGGTFLGLEASGGAIYTVQFGAVHPAFGGAFVSSDGWDNIIFEQVPEVSSSILLISGLMALLLRPLSRGIRLVLRS